MNYLDDNRPPKPCVRCGYCCKAVPCAHPQAKWNETRTQCTQLYVDRVVDGVEFYACKVWADIDTIGAGCTSTAFNTERHKRLVVLSK
jgi:hypothetical protein